MISEDKRFLTSLADLEGVEPHQPRSEPEGASSSLITRCNNLYRTPLADLSVDDIRLLVNQNIGTRFLVPLALKHLRENPLVQGDHYPGDLLAAVMRLDAEFWAQNQDAYWEIREIASGLLPIFEALEADIQQFNKKTEVSSSKN